MTGHRPKDQSDNDTPVPRDPPDQQQSQEGGDPLDAHGPDEFAEQANEPDQSIPDMDETGAGRRGAPRSGGVHPEQPVPDEPSG
ncbi:hypothetical protein J7E87_28525 [Streptomyces sp. ISL-1]|uniref:hypothetical protein n=1 Tax=Streptomyces sp. ISL-1 TaxID=2817657 RepID=UPI001BE90707|nr:hypothetical protein [Streptomyces sp. ISL-1]MBT2393269.1 hypothetical protein [Streptomyces sp. ISL-1]